ncbi:MAG: type II toxin-antitoxin system PemK/MazF family toxin [Limnochordales bacterium]|nr:type II toxin-antitoxin system PemK/MazF family toxin [Limnochordales bacterium]
MKPQEGMVLWVELGKRLPPGREQEGRRPALLVGVPSRLGKPRFPVLVVAPVTTYRGQPWAEGAPGLYPRLKAGAGNLPRESIVLLDQLQVVDVERVTMVVGQLNQSEYAPVREGLEVMFGISSKSGL